MTIAAMCACRPSSHPGTTGRQGGWDAQVSAEVMACEAVVAAEVSGAERGRKCSAALLHPFCQPVASFRQRTLSWFALPVTLQVRSPPVLVAHGEPS